MTKEEKIQEAWKNWKYIAIDGGVDDNGWTNYAQNYGSFPINDFDQQQCLTGATIRPISLRGIENNNGWTKIESEEDLPKEEGTYEVYNLNPDIIFITVNIYFSKNDVHEHYLDGAITHYKPYNEIPPIY